jgi:signal peptidase II
MTIKQRITICTITLLLNISLDRITKYIASVYLKDNNPIVLLNNTVLLVFTENKGAFLSLGSKWPEILKYIILLYIPLLICILAVIYCIVRDNSIKKMILIISIVSGGMSNLFDRLMNDFKVIDFMNFGIGKLRTGILNVADLSITFGILIFLISEFGMNKRTSG